MSSSIRAFRNCFVLTTVLVQKRDIQAMCASKTVSSIRVQNANVSLPHKNAIVVGGTSGIGEGIAHRLAKANVSVTIIGRSKARGEEVVKTLSSLSSSKEVNHNFVACDSFMMKNIQAVCSDIKSKQQSLDYLVLTQGMATTQGRTETQEGIDQKLALHYFGRMMFVKELLPLLRASGEQEGDAAKVLTVLSAGVHKPYEQYRDNFDLSKEYTLSYAANSAGFYNDLAVDAWSKQSGNEKIAFIHAAPGFVNTNWGTEMPWYLKAAVRLIQPLGRSPDDCGEVMCDPLFNRKEGGFFLIDNNANETQKTKLHSDEARDFVFAETLKMLDAAVGKK